MASPYREMQPGEDLSPDVKRYVGTTTDVEVLFRFDDVHAKSKTFVGDTGPDDDEVQTFRSHPYLRTGDTHLRDFLDSSKRLGYLVMSSDLIIPWNRLLSIEVVKRVNRPVNFTWRQESRR